MISGINGSQPIQPNNNDKNTQIDAQVQEFKISIFSECDTDKSGKLEAKNSNGENEVKSFKAKVDKFIQLILGKSDKTATTQDVQNITNQQTVETSEPKFDADGNLQTDVTNNDDGSKDIKAGSETIHVDKDGNSFSVKDDSGRSVSITKTPDGGFEFTDEKGDKYKFDKDMNPVN